MGSIEQQTALVAAQQELQKLKGSGRQLLEALADTGNNSNRAQQVTSSNCLQCSNITNTFLDIIWQRDLRL